MASTSEEWGGLPVELRAIVVNLLGKKQRHIFRLGLCRKNGLAPLLPLLEFIRFNYYKNSILPKSFVGSHPTMLELKDIPEDPGDVDVLASILRSVSTLHINLRANYSLEASQRFMALGPQLGRVQELSLTTSAPSATVQHILESWIPYMKELSVLQFIRSAADDCRVFESLQKAQLKLKVLDIVFTIQKMRMLLEIADKLPRAEKLILSSGFFYKLTGGDQHELDLLDKALSNSSGSLSNIYVRMFDQLSYITHVIPLHGFCFARESDETLWQRHLDSINRVGVNERYNGHSTILNYLIVGAFSFFSETKLRMLLDAGADPLTRSKMNLHRSVGRVSGSILHLIFSHGSKDAALSLVDQINWAAIASINDLRMSSGFLPIHLCPQDFDVWLAVYQAMKKRFPAADLLMDDLNWKGWVPIRSILVLGSPRVDQNVMISIIEFVLNENSVSSKLVLYSSSFVFSLLQAVSDCLRSGNFSERIYAVIQRVVDPYLQHHVDPSVKSSLSSLGVEADDSLSLGKLLFVCSAYAPQIFDLVIEQESNMTRSLCLERILDHADYPTAHSSILKILDCGIHPNPYNYDEESDWARQYVLTFLNRRWTGKANTNKLRGYLATVDDLDHEKTKPRWQCFWRLVDVFKPQLAISEEESHQVTQSFFGEDAALEFLTFSPPGDILRFCEWSRAFAPAASKKILRSLRSLFEYEKQDRVKAQGKSNRFQWATRLLRDNGLLRKNKRGKKKE